MNTTLDEARAWVAKAQRFYETMVAGAEKKIPLAVQISQALAQIAVAEAAEASVRPVEPSAAPPRLFAAHHRAMGSSTVYFGPFATVAEWRQWVTDHGGVGGLLLIAHRPDSDESEWWGEPPVPTDAEWEGSDDPE